MFALLFLLSSGDAQLVNAAPPPKTGDTIVCRSHKPTGSRFSKRICTLKKDDEARAARDQAAMKGWVDSDQPNPPETPPRN